MKKIWLFYLFIPIATKHQIGKVFGIDIFFVSAQKLVLVLVMENHDIRYAPSYFSDMY